MVISLLQTEVIRELLILKSDVKQDFIQTLVLEVRNAKKELDALNNQLKLQIEG
ncbi:hypothetical protein ACQZV8_20375 [Magnetococcales bacterium HHB-1]